MDEIYSEDALPTTRPTTATAKRRKSTCSGENELLAHPDAACAKESGVEPEREDYSGDRAERKASIDDKDCRIREMATSVLRSLKARDEVLGREVFERTDRDQGSGTGLLQHLDVAFEMENTGCGSGNGVPGCGSGYEVHVGGVGDGVHVNGGGDGILKARVDNDDGDLAGAVKGGELNMRAVASFAMVYLRMKYRSDGLVPIYGSMNGSNKAKCDIHGPQLSHEHDRRERNRLYQRQYRKRRSESKKVAAKTADAETLVAVTGDQASSPQTFDRRERNRLYQRKYRQRLTEL